MNKKLKIELDSWVKQTNRKEFIALDPISVPHRFSKKQDIEITGFFAAIMAWGNRKTIINKALELMDRMDNDPFNFITNASETNFKQIENFAHRTLNDMDVLFLIDFLRRHYSNHSSLEAAFFPEKNTNPNAVEAGLKQFRMNVFSVEYAPNRTKKHIATPETKSACKRLNMFLRWMVRKDQQDVDFGIWQHINPSQLICPLDVHVQRVALRLGIIKRTQSDWLAAVELTDYLRKLDPLDPVKYDYALFGMGISKV